MAGGPPSGLTQGQWEQVVAAKQREAQGLPAEGESVAAGAQPLEMSGAAEAGLDIGGMMRMAGQPEPETRTEEVRRTGAVSEVEDPLAVSAPEYEIPLFVHQPSKKKAASKGKYKIEGMTEEGQQAVQAGLSRVGGRAGQQFAEARRLREQGMWDEHEALGEQIKGLEFDKQKSEFAGWKLKLDLPEIKRQYEQDKAAYRELLKKGVSYAAAWDRMGEARRAIGGLAVALGGFVEGFTMGKVRNRAIGMVNQAIERDVQDQKMSMVNALTSFGLSEKDYSSMMKRIDGRVQDVRNAMKGIARLKLQQAALKTGNAKAIENSAKMLSGIQYEGLKQFAKAEPTATLSGRLKATPTGKLGEAELRRVITGKGPKAAAARGLARPGKPVAAVKRPTAVHVSEAQKQEASQKQFMKHGYTSAVYDDSGKIVKPGKVRLAGRVFDVGRIGRKMTDMEKVPPKILEELSNGASLSVRAAEIAERQFTKKHKGVGAGKWFNLRDWLRGYSPWHPEKLTKAIADGLGVMQAVAVQGARPAKEEQQIFAKWWIKPGDTKDQVRRKLDGMLGELNIAFKQRVANYHPSKYDPRGLMEYQRGLENFKRKIRDILGKPQPGPYARTGMISRMRPKTK